VIASYAVKRQDLSAFDLGYAQQAMLFDVISKQQGKPPLVINSARFLQDPESHLRTVCEQMNIPFEQNMLQWPSGTRDSDGLWGAHWYDSVTKSTCFGPANNKPLNLSSDQQKIVDLCEPYYQSMSQHAL